MTVNRRQMLTACALIAGSEIVRAAQKEEGTAEPATDRPHCAVSEVPEDLRKAIDGYDAASTGFMSNDPTPLKTVYSHCEDVTIFGGFGGYEHGWSEQVEKRLEWAASRFQGGVSTSENISLIVTPELACNVGLEHMRVQLAGTSGTVEIDLRVTTVFRREGEQWRVVHRHADPLVKVQDAPSIVRK